MHIYSVMPQISRANSIRKNDRVQSDNQTMPVAMSVPPPDYNPESFLVLPVMIKTYTNLLLTHPKIKGLE